MSEWRTIDSAPRNKRVLLGWWDEINVWMMDVGYASHGWRNDIVSNISHHGSATHWMPLPNPPEK